MPRMLAISLWIPLLCILNSFSIADASIGPIDRRSQLFRNNKSHSSNNIPFVVAAPKDIPESSASSETSKSKIDATLTKYHHHVPRGGQDKIDGVIRVVGTVTQTLISCGRAILPPTFACVKGIVNFYRALPIDAVIAQVGLVYCFAGGYYPTLFSSLEAARHCGWEIAVEAVKDLTDEAIKVIDATAELPRDAFERKEIFLQQTNIVLKTVDPMKINQAAAALYTTWLGISTVLEKEYARVINLSMTLAGFFERIAHFILEPPVKMCISQDYHKWVPVVIGWIAKAAAMNIAWRIQRVLTASTSAMVGGVMFARALFRMISRKGFRLFGLIREDDTESPLDEIVGFTVGGFGFWTQIQTQYKNGFTFEVPFPFNLITWPMDWAERWIQWQITK